MPVFNVPFVLSVAGAFLTSSAIAYIYVWPALHAMPRAGALRLLAAFHAFRFFGMNFLVAGFVSPELSSDFASKVGWGDLIAAGFSAFLNGGALLALVNCHPRRLDIQHLGHAGSSERILHGSDAAQKSRSHGRGDICPSALCPVAACQPRADLLASVECQIG